MDTTIGLRRPPEESPALEFAGKVMVVAIIIIFFVIVFIYFFRLYAKLFWWGVERTALREAQNRRNRRRRPSAGEDPAGLDPSVLRFIPVVVFNPEDFNEGLECSVCLSELEQGDKVRLLPKCSHGFHVECIDMWFQSHSTCPLCRNLVTSECSTESLDVPTNVFLDSMEEGSSLETNSASSSLIIDVPMHMSENSSSSSPSDTRLAEEELKSPMARRLGR